MGMKKECSCSYWSKEQGECLYSGHGCARDKPEVTDEWIEKKVEELILIIQKMIVEDVYNPDENKKALKDFIRSFVGEG